MQDFRKLQVWQESQDFALAIHGATSRLRGPEGSVLRGQLRRAALSIGANIAEGTGTDSPKRFAAFLQNAIASASEVESHLDAIGRLQLLPPKQLADLTADVVRIRRRTIALRKRVLEAGKPTTQNQKPATEN
jgi:four helix bundle protein